MQLFSIALTRILFGLRNPLSARESRQCKTPAYRTPFLHICAVFVALLKADRPILSDCLCSFYPVVLMLLLPLPLPIFQWKINFHEVFSKGTKKSDSADSLSHIHSPIQHPSNSSYFADYSLRNTMTNYKLTADKLR